MASLSLNPSFHPKQSKTRPRGPVPRSRAPLPCRSHADPSPGGDEQQRKPEKKEGIKEEEKKKERRRWSLVSLFGEAEKLRESLKPREKGDWKDLFLMSFAFAVYIYISQQIVCAYCAWMSML